MGIVRDADTIVGFKALKDHAAETSSTDGTGLDCQPASYQGPLFGVHLTAVGATADTLDLLIQGSADNSAWTTVATFAQIDLGDIGTELKAGFDAGVGPMRYYRYSSTVNSGGSFTYSVFIIGTEPSHAPVPAEA
jgi:hypothetical protein